jgi:hypothetical protein
MKRKTISVSQKAPLDRHLTVKKNALDVSLRNRIRYSEVLHFFRSGDGNFWKSQQRLFGCLLPSFPFLLPLIIPFFMLDFKAREKKSCRGGQWTPTRT